MSVDRPSGKNKLSLMFLILINTLVPAATSSFYYLERRREVKVDGKGRKT